MNKTTTKKIIGGTVIVALVVTIGAALVIAETDDTAKDNSQFDCFEMGRPMGGHRPFVIESTNNSTNRSIPFRDVRGDKAMNESLPFFSELTEEQQNEIESLREDMIKEGATPEEIREAVSSKLQEFGIEIQTRDDILDSEIERTTQRLEILERQKELREEGYSWEEIQNIISEEFELKFPEGHQPGLLSDGGFHRVHDEGDFHRTFVDIDDSDT